MDVVIFGTGEVAEVFHYYLTREGMRQYNVVAFTLDWNFIQKGHTHLGLPIVPFDELQLPSDARVFVAASFKNVNADRTALLERVRARGFRSTSYLSPRAWAWDGFVGYPNTFIMENNVIQPYTTIGENCILWSGNHVGHHTHIGDNVFIASHAVISGHVTIGDNTFIGVNATIRDGITIGKRCVIGAGALVLHDLPDESVVGGVESKPRSMKSSALRSI